MRTTIDLPDSLYREVKATAAASGLKLKEFISQSLHDTLRRSGAMADDDGAEAAAHRKRMEEHFRRMTENRKQAEPVGKLNRASLYNRHA